jgi:gliding motility-associated-like protein
MSRIKIVFIIVIISFIPNWISAQISIDDTQNADQLVQVLTNNNSCLTVYPASASGSIINKSFASFNKNGSNFPFTAGVVLSTWESNNSKGPYNPSFSNSVESWSGDSNMNSILGITSYNATTLEFEFESSTNFLSFNYIFASNEYIRDYPCKYSDGLAILIKDITTNSNYINIATLPDGTPVSSKNIHPAINFTNTSLSKCDAKNDTYFGQFNTDLAIASPINYAGHTKALNAQSKLEIGHRYKIKFVIAEDNNRAQFSALFIEAGSFTSKIDLGKDKLVADNSAICTGETFEIKTNLSNPTYSFKWFKDGSASPLIGETNPSLIVANAGTYKVEVSDPSASCIFTGEIKIEYTIGMGLKDVQLAKCDDNGLGTAFFDLTSLKTVLANNNPDTTISNFYEDSNLTIEITNPTAFEKTNSGDQIVYAKGINSKLSCSETAQITLKTLASSQNLSSLPTPIIKEFTGGKNSIELITPSTNSNYEFSIDGINYQSNALFTSVPKGNYIAYIRNTTNCEYATYPFTILDYPSFFTPNGDGINDVWKIMDLINYPNAKVSIFDRYGKLLKQMNKDSNGWNGTLNSLPLPADDYWFRLVLNENQIVNGHFSLKR